MKILLTGATGFLGKELLALLLADDRIEQVWVTTRKKKTHPHRKVSVIQMDLSDPAQLVRLRERPDAVIHLAGLYDFTQSFGACYTQNVLASLHLAVQLKEWNQIQDVPLFFASTYAVTYGQDKNAAEAPLISLPPSSIPYAYTKALAEKAITDSEIPAAVFRLGILVGNSRDGHAEKWDGAYSFLRLIESAKGPIGIASKLPGFKIPFPAQPDGILPLVPVDSAAKVFQDALFLSGIAGVPAKIYGVYDESSVPIRDFASSVMDHLLPGVAVRYVKSLPDSVLKLQSLFSPVSRDAFQFAMKPVALNNPAFKTAFASSRIPRFSDYEKAFHSGYRLQTGGSRA